jgi:hypothetical protein
VGEAQVKLHELEKDLKRLQTRVATSMIANEQNIPLESHIENLRQGVEVLTEARSGREERKAKS